MKYQQKRLTALMLAVIMAFSLLPLSSFAAETDSTPPVEAVEEIPVLPGEDDFAFLPEVEPVEEVSHLPDPIDLGDIEEVPELPIMDEAAEVEETPEEPPMEVPEESLPVERPAVDIMEDLSSALEPIMDKLMDDLNAAVLLAASDYSINSVPVNLTTPGTYTISGTGAKTTNNITISGPGEYDISLVNVSINCSATKGKAAMALQNGAQVHLTIADTSTLTSGENRAGIEVPEDCSLEIDGTGTLTVTGGAGQYDAAAGIGGGTNQTNGPITISGGNITANGGDHSYNGASGIGGGCGADGQDITISGGTIVANGSIESYNGAAGIGGGSLGSAADIIVLGGSVTAYASKNSHLGAAGIGGGYMGSARRLSFSGGTTNATSSSSANTNGAGIGGGYGGTASYITVSGNATVKANEGNPNVTFDGSNGAGIGGGGASGSGDDKVGGDADHITISGGTVIAYGNSQGAGIGGGSGGTATHIEITGGTVETYGGRTPASDSYLSGAGIGGGAYGYAEDITIHTEKKDTQTIKAYSGYGSAAIGGGCHGYAKDITIQSSNILANATQNDRNGINGCGAGIGGGLYGAGINILIDDSIVNTRAHSGAGIGSGHAMGSVYNSTSTSNWEHFITTGGALLHGDFPEDVPVAANIDICNSAITAQSDRGAAIGLGSYCRGLGDAGQVTQQFAMDIDIQSSTISLTAGTANGEGGAGIGTGSYAKYCLSHIVINECEDVHGSFYEGAALGSGSNNNWSDMDLSITNCGTLSFTNRGTSGSYGGAGIGTGCYNYGGHANIAVDNCTSISVSVGLGTGLGSGSYNGAANHETVLSMSVSNCESIELIKLTSNSSTYGSTGIGSGHGSRYDCVEVTVQDCGPISVQSTGTYNSVGIGVGRGNYNNTVHVSILESGPISMSGYWYYGTGIGIGYYSYSSDLAHLADYQILLQDCESLSLTSYGEYYTGIGLGRGTHSCVGEVVVDNCGPILINHTSGCESVGIGYGYGTYWATNSAEWYEPHASVQIKNCDDITVVMDSYRNTGIGMGEASYYATGEIAITDCGNISVFHGYDPAYNSSRTNNEWSVGIGLGYNSHNCNLSISIARSGDVSTRFYQDSDGTPTFASYGTGIGSAYNCYSSNSSYKLSDGTTSYFPNSLDIQIQECGTVEANCGQNGVAIGLGNDNRDITSYITIQDCESIFADGSYYGTGIGCGYGCYSNYSFIPGASSTVKILGCEGGVTATGGRYGAAIGSGGNLRSNATVTVDIQDSGTITATQYKLVDDSTIFEDSAAQRGHAAAIGSGWSNNGNSQVSVSIQNCTVNAYAEDSSAIGCGDRANNATVDITLENCTVNAEGGNGAGIGFGDFDSNSTANITLTDCETTATSLTYGAGIGGGLKNNRCISNITVDGGKLDAIGAGGGSGIGTGPVNTVSQANVTIDGDAVVVATGSGATDEQLAEGDNPIGTDAGAGIGGTGDQYVGNITIRSGDITAVGGSIDGCCAAGIGGSSNAKAGTVTISGGTVHATGGHCDQCGAAGIGGGANSNAGTVTISGGEVTALGSHGEKMGGAGIGGGPRGDGGTVIIEGGTVNAIGSERGAGIGGGFNGNGGDVTISGGTITATSGLYDAAGIGGGANGEGGTLTLSGDPTLKVYGKSSNLAITSEITTSIPLFQGTMAQVSEEESIISFLERLEDGTTGGGDTVTLPANYDAFSLTVPDEGTYSAYLQSDKRYLLSTMEDAVEEFQLTNTAPTDGKWLTIIRFFDVAFDTGDGTPVEPQSVRMGTTVTLPKDPTKEGYIFGGWYLDEDSDDPYDFTLPVMSDLTLHAKWIEIVGQPYIIYHYKATLEGDWDIGTIEYGGQLPGELVVAQPIKFMGFTEDKDAPDRIPSGYTQEDEILTLKLYYQRSQINVAVENAGEEYPTQLTAPYGTLIVLGKPSKDGYDFDKWTTEDGATIDSTMPASIESLGDVIFANWVLQDGQAGYQVKHYIRTLEGAYVLRVAEDYCGTVGDTVTAVPNNYTGFHINHSISDETATGIIQADNSMALRLYYDRDLITVQLLETHNTAEEVTVEYGAAANLPTPSWPGYTFEGWLKEDGTLYQDEDTIETLGEAVTAQWSAGATTLYTVRYYKQDIQGEEMEIISLEDLHGAAGSTAKAVIRTYPGFTFAPELSNVSGTVDAEEPLILNVYYTRNTYDVDFVSNGGSAVEAQESIYYTALATQPDTPTKQGYDFEGWYTDKKLSDKHNFGVPVTHDLTLYAKWTPRDDTAYTVYHYQQDVTGTGYTLADTDHLEGTTDSTVTAEAKDYPGFHRNTEHKGNVVSAKVVPNGSTELALYYDRNLHTVTFHTLGGSSVAKVSGIRYGATVTQPKAPTKQGYTFRYWLTAQEDGEQYSFATPITANLALYALWQANTYQVTFDYQGATGGNSTASKTVTYDAAYGELPSPTRHGYDFLGWFTAAQAGDEVTDETVVKITATQTLYAHWSSREDTPYTVQHYHQSPTGTGYVLVDTDNLTGTTDTIVTAQPKEYLGLMEDTANTLRVASGNLAGDGSLVLKLYYTRARHNLIVDRANGQGVETHTYLYGATVPMPSEPRRRGYSFVGWTAKGVELGEGDSFVMPDNAVTLTAIWEAVDYSVTYKYKGTIPPDAPALPDGGKNHNIGATLEVAPVPILEGYTFQGWTPSSNISVTDGKFVMPDGNVTFTGVWRKGLHNVIYVYQGNVPDNAPQPPADTNAYHVGAEVAVLPEPTLEGYAFSGWDSGDVEIVDGVFEMPVTNVVLWGSWAPTLYEVKFSYAGDVPASAQALPNEDQRAMDDTVAVPAVAPVEGYRFLGWAVDGQDVEDGAFQMPAMDIAIVGRWEKVPYRVTYAYTGKTPAKAPALPKEAAYTMGDTVQPAAAPTLKGYAFSGWGEAFEMPAEDVTLIGSWSLVDYQISYVLDGGTAPAGNPTSYTIESPAITFAAPTKAGYTFQGWFSDNGFTTPVSTLPAGSTGNLTLYAKWEKVSTPSGSGGGGGGGSISVPAVTPSKPALNKADHIAYIQGFTDGTVRPQANISRAEVAMIFFRLLTEETRRENATTAHTFSDVADNAWYTEAVATLAAMDIVRGRGNGQFDPAATISRAEFAAIAARFDSSAYSGPDLFPDISGHWASKEINRAAQKGWVKGDNNGLFRPDAPITRAEAVTLINRVLERQVGKDGVMKAMKTFPDNADPAVWYYYDIQEAANGHAYTKDKSGAETWIELKK